MSRVPTTAEINRAIEARRRAFNRVANFVKSLASERSELGAEAKEILEDLQHLRPFTH